MPLNTIQTHVAGLLDGLAIPGTTDTLTTYITPPTVEQLDGPRCYVWGGSGRERRQTMPRKFGFKQMNWTVDIYLIYLSSTTDPNIDLDQAFPVLIDATMAALRAAVMPIIIQDPTTGVQSQLMAIGEDFDLEYPPEVTPDSQRLIYYSCRIAAPVMEVMQG